MTPQQQLMDAEDALDFALRCRDHETIARITKTLPALREAAQEQRSKERMDMIFGPLRKAFGNEPQQ